MNDNNKIVMPSYRILDKSEVGMVRPIFDKYGEGMPDPNLSLISVANIEGYVAGMLTLQMVWHMEPLWVGDRRVRFNRLIELLEGVLPIGTPYYAFAPTIQISHACESNGMEKKPWSIYCKRVGGS